MRKLLYCALCLLFVMGMAGQTKAAYFRGDNDQNISDVISGDAFLAGSSVRVNQGVQGELMAVANNLNISGKGDRSLFLAGSNVTVEKGTGYNAYVAGNSVELRGEYGHDVYVMGNRVTLEKDAVIKGELHVMGSEVTIHGTIEGNVFAMSQNFSSDAVIGGLLKVESDNITFTGGSVAKDFDYHSNKTATGLDKVKIGGSTHRSDLQDYRQQRSRSPLGTLVYSFFSSLVFGLLILVAAKRLGRETVLQTQHKWTNSLLLGIATLFAVPLIFLLLLVTVIGIKAAFVVISLYAIMLAMAGTLGMLLVGDVMMKQLAPNYESSVWVSLIVGVLAVTALCALPILGGWLSFLFFVGITVPMLGSVVGWLGKQMS